MDRQELKAWLAFNAAPGIGPVRFQWLLRVFGSLAEALKLPAEEFAAQLPALAPDLAAEVLQGARAFDAEDELAYAKRQGIALLSLRDEDYPPGLRAAHAPPPLLYLRGKLAPPALRLLAVVGTREPTPYGRKMTIRLAEDLARAGCGIVSGLARGIDGEAHRACLQAGGVTLAVLGSGLSEIYPASHAGLANAICDGGGALISQFPMRMPPAKYNFPRRNAVLAALCAGVVVVEGADDSGSLITARAALEEGRDVFAVPGPADSLKSRGPNRLIQSGAKLVLAVGDILEEYPEFSSTQLPAASPPARLPLELDGEESRLWLLLKELGRMPLAELAERASMDAGCLSASLTMLEIKGAARQLPGALVEAV